MGEPAGSRTAAPIRRALAAVVLVILTATGAATPALGQATLSCSVTDNGDGDGSVTIAWNDIGANGYDVIEDDQAKRWTTRTSTTDTTPGTTYKIVAFGNGTNWTTATCNNPNPPGGGPPAGLVTVLAAGDIGECDGYHVPFVGDLVERRTDALWLALGDIAYPEHRPAPRQGEGPWSRRSNSVMLWVPSWCWAGSWWSVESWWSAGWW